MANADIVYEATRLMLRLEDPDKIPSVLDCLLMMGMTYAALKFSGLKQKIRELKRHPIYGNLAEKILMDWKNDDLANGSRPIPSSSSSTGSSTGSSSGYSSSSPTDSCESHPEVASPPAPAAVAAPSIPVAAAAVTTPAAPTTKKRKSTGCAGAPLAKQLIITEHNEPRKWADFKIPKATGPKPRTATAILSSVLGEKSGNGDNSRNGRSERKQEAVRRAKLLTARLAIINKSKNDEEKKRKEIPSLLTLEIDLTKMV